MPALPLFARARRSALSFSFFAAASLASMSSAHAASIALGVNAGHGESATLYASQETYKPFADQLSRALNVKVDSKPLLASLVKMAVKGDQYPLLLVHTHDAAEAIRSGKYEVIGFSQDLGSNHIQFFARKDSTAKSLADVAGRCVVVADPLARAVVEVVLKNENLIGKLQAFKYVREVEALELHLKSNFCEIAALRSDAIAQKLQTAGYQQIYRSKEVPVYVLLADKRLGNGSLEKLRKLVVEFQPEPNSAFMKETGIVSFVSSLDSAMQLISQF